MIVVYAILRNDFVRLLIHSKTADNFSIMLQNVEPSKRVISLMLGAIPRETAPGSFRGFGHVSRQHILRI